MRLVDASEPWSAAPDTAAGEVLVAATREELAGLARLARLAAGAHLGAGQEGS